MRSDILDKIIKYSLWGIIFCLPFSKSFVEIFTSLAIVSWGVEKIIRKDFSLKKTDIMNALIFFIVINAVSLIYSDYFYLSARALFSKCLQYIALFFIVYEKVTTKEQVRDILKIMLISVFVITLDGFIQKFHYAWIDPIRGYSIFSENYPTATFPFPNDYATWIITLLPVGLVLFLFGLKRDPIPRYVALGAAITLAFSLYLTKARGAWFGFFVSILSLGLLRTKKIVMAFFVICAFLYFISPPKFKKDITSNLSFIDRHTMWTTSFRMFKVHPVRGFGMNTFYQHYKKYREDKFTGIRGSYAHNCYLQTAVELGIVGLFSFLYLLVRIFQTTLRKIRRIGDPFYSSLGLGIWAGLLGFCVYGAFDTNFYSLPLVTLFWFMTGLLFSVVNIHEKAV